MAVLPKDRVSLLSFPLRRESSHFISSV